MKEHTVVGARMLERIPLLQGRPSARPLLARALGRRRLPRRSRGWEIPLGARIIAACDAFHAMTSDRPYRDALSPQQAAAELERLCRTQFDPAVIEALVAALDLPAGEVVDLRTAIGF